MPKLIVGRVGIANFFAVKTEMSKAQVQNFWLKHGKELHEKNVVFKRRCGYPPQVYVVAFPEFLMAWAASKHERNEII